MVPGPRSQERNVRGVALLLVCLGLLALLPSRPVAAQNIYAQSIDNNQGSFADGVFQRTSLTPDRTTLPANDPVPPVDLEGAVQLSPAGVLKAWDPVPNTLPVAVSGHGVTALGNRIYAVAGSVGTTYSNAAYWATVDPITGALQQTSPGSGQFWNTSTLSNAQMVADSALSTSCRAVVPARRTNVAVAGLPTGGNTGHIFVIGGTVAVQGCDEQNISTPLIQRGTVAANGTITWANIGFMPSPPVPNDPGTGVGARTVGVEGASTVIARTRTAAGVEHYYLYVIGGRRVFFDEVNGSGTLSRVLNSVFYTEVDPASGNLKHPTGAAGSVWARLPNLPQVVTPGPDEGLWNATASATSIEVGTEVRSAIFLSGGAFDVNGSTAKINPYLYRASVNSSTGALTWSSTPGQGPSQVTLAGRKGLSSLVYNNKFYAVGGRTTDTNVSALDTVPTALLDDSLNVVKFGSIFFFGTDAVNDRVLGSGGTGRFNTGVALVKAQPPANVPPGTTINSAWTYVLGGNNNAGNATNTVFRGSIGGDESSVAARAPDGWYYSGVIKVTGFGSQTRLARLLSVNWSADLGRNLNPNADIRLEFRKTITASGECDDDSIFTNSSEDRWRAVDGDPGSAFFSKQAIGGALFNKVSMATVFGSETLNATCFQYRAHLLQNSAGGAGPVQTSSPKLLQIYVEKVIAGNADLNIPTNGFSITTNANKQISSFVVRVQNLSTQGLDETLSVDDARLPNPEGSIFVNLCMTYGASSAPALTLPDPRTFNDSHKALCPAYAVIGTSEMGKGVVLDLRQPTRFDGSPRWYSNASGNPPITDLLTLFRNNGFYRIGLVIDTYNFVPEGTNGETNNRGETATLPNGTILTFEVQGAPVVVDPNDIFFPLVRR